MIAGPKAEGNEMALEEEMETFVRELPALLAEPGNRGHFALIHGQMVAGIFPTFDAALSVGYEKFELAPFLVQEVVDRQHSRHFSRSLRCHS